MLKPTSGRKLTSLRGPLLAIFDVHGTLLKPTWLEEFIRTYRRLTGSDRARARLWAEGWAVRQAKAQVVADLSRVSGRPKAEVEASFARARAEVNAEAAPRAIAGARSFVAALRRRGIPIVMLSGSRHAVIVRQLRERGFLDLVFEENIVAADDVTMRGPVWRDRAIKALSLHFPGHVLLNFNDWIGGMGIVRRLGGFNFGLPQSTDWEKNRRTLIEAGADFILHDWREAPEILKHLPRRAAPDAEPIPICEDKAQELPLVLPAHRHGGFALCVDVGRDLSRLTYHKVKDDSRIFGENGTADYRRMKLKKIASFSSGGLLAPERFIRNGLPARVHEAIEPLRQRAKRYTRYDGIVTSWDGAVDKNVWGANIDTVFLQRVLSSIPMRRVCNALEIGTGGGHISAFLAARLGAGLRELSISDISLYALCAAKRNIQPYLSPGVRLRTFLGKGIATIPGGADLIVVNPPYIPTSPFDFRPHRDPYRGTGLIREIIGRGPGKLNAANPGACIIMNVSSLAAHDLAAYSKMCAERMTIEPVGKPLKVPLKIYSISQEWKDWLVAQGLLEFHPAAGPADEPYWHTLQAYRIIARSCSASNASLH